MTRRRARNRPFALFAAVLVHVGLLGLLLRGGAPPLPSAPVMVSLWETQGPTSGPAPGPESGAPAQAAEPDPAEASARPQADATPHLADAASAAPAEPAPPAVAETPVEPPTELAPDFTAAPVEPPTAFALEALGAQAAAQVPPASGDAAAMLAALGGAGDPCQLTEWLQGLLTTDPSVQAALARLPASRRSVANAVMLWDGGWVEARASPGEDLLQPIRQAILAGLASAPPECRDHWMSGPRFIALADQRQSTVLALGSGAWRWSDLLAAPLSAAPAPPLRR